MQNTTFKNFLPWLLLASRCVLFLAFQALFALGIRLAGNPAAWHESARWWMFVAALANLVSIGLLGLAFRAEGKHYLDILRFSRNTVGKDLLWLLGASVVGLPMAAAPMGRLAVALFGDAMTPVEMMFRPLPPWALAVGLLFPLTIAFAELPTYFGYVMPRLFPGGSPARGWAGWLLAALFLGVQHSFLPFIPDGRFILWRAGMYLPFALFAGLVLKLRPGLLPYLAILHALMDVSAVAVYWMV